MILFGMPSKTKLNKNIYNYLPRVMFLLPICLLKWSGSESCSAPWGVFWPKMLYQEVQQIFQQDQMVKKTMKGLYLLTNTY